ncbi:PREDICTED: uncharacterized protein LOC18588400 isoform X1 [Theobroma cacao]|uniref:Uncharacterized protein LOC18588400 isoform X1 n=2 Tax=Theobroma cacao TaxID=3641 RepID=A0AB32UPL6_THECC|nr:PREDICTED: uncharacterized protein LOC18588400 isoform X1 [Theobroma cacao]
MATPQSITDLFARLAFHLQLPISERENEEEALNLAISKLNQSLNLNENHDSRVRVMDTALSLMCFKAPQVFDSVIEYLVKTIVSVLSSSVNCKVFLLQNQEFLLIGSASLGQNSVELVEMCNNVYAQLEGKGVFSHLLLRAVVRGTVLASRYQYSYPFVPILDVKSIEGRSAAVSKLHCHLPTELSLENEELPLRLLFWYLDPLILKQAISKILEDTTGRPFICLSEEFHQRIDWRSIIICLVLSPVMFIETRALLHSWFLKTGLASVLQLLVGLVSAVLDVISRPTWWGISMELGSKLPFSCAYFPNKNHLLRILAGTFSAENFLHLVHATSELVSLGKEQLHPAVKPKSMDVTSIDHKSLWALAVDFPDWFYFASCLLFPENSLRKEFHLKCTFAASKVGETHDKELLSISAARYISWILSPVSKSNQDLLVDFLTKISESWALKQYDSVMHNKEAAACKKKCKKPKLYDKREHYSLANEYDCQKMGIWLNEIENIYLQYANKTVNSSASADSNASHGSTQQNVLLRRIPLGILIGCPNCITEDACALLLHYAATGNILRPRETVTSGLRHVKQKSERQDLTIWMGKCSKRDVLAGACLVFTLTDAVDSISASLFDTEDSELEYIYQVKVKAGKYLMKCIKRLSQLNIDKDEVLTLRDLRSRLGRWRHQGQETLQVQNDIDDVINDLSQKLSSL